MSEPQVTITLGRTGQVVKKGGPILKNARSESGTGSKRSLEVTFEILSNKRLRKGGDEGNSGINGIDDSQIGRNDLRLKLMHKSSEKRVAKAVEEYKNGDRHEKLSKATKHRVPHYMPQPKGISLEDITDDLDQVGSMPIPMKASHEASRQFVPRTGFIENIPQVVGHLTVPSFLRSLGLGKYCAIFQAEEVDMTALKQMKDKDLKDIGIPMGPRKKILLAVSPRKRQP